MNEFCTWGFVLFGSVFLKFLFLSKETEEHNRMGKADVSPEFFTSSPPGASLNCFPFFTLSFWAYMLQEECLQPQVWVKGLDVSQQVMVTPCPLPVTFSMRGTQCAQWIHWINQHRSHPGFLVRSPKSIGVYAKNSLNFSDAKKSLDYLMLITSWMVHCSLKYL